MKCLSASRCAAALPLLLLSLLAPRGAAATCSGDSFPSTFALIQKVVLEDHGCTNAICHGSTASGGLDLSAPVAYANLVDVAAQTVTGFSRVSTGSKDRSLLWLNLAAKTFPNSYTAPLRAMPLDPVPALTVNQLELVRRWIEAGAPRDAVVAGTAELVDACLPPPQPIEIAPLPPPASGTGVQIHMPRWTLPAQSENEVCFASYYDVTDQVPVELRQPNGTFRYKASELRQDPLSHHLIVNLFEGAAAADDPNWGEFRCRGGARDGESCNPLDLGNCGAGSDCGADPKRSFACIGYGPSDSKGRGFSRGVIASQETVSHTESAEGVYNELPLKGIIKWNSHGFNVTGSAGKLEAWLNFEFALPQEQITPERGIFNVSRIFSMNVPAFSTQELCAVHTLPPNAHLHELSSHTHKRGKRFRIFDGAWRCQGGRRNGSACSPFGPDFNSNDLCPDASCVSTIRAPFGDCDRDGAVTVDEILTGVNVALGAMPLQSCRDEDGNRDGQVSVDELLVSVRAALGAAPEPARRDAQASLLFVNLVYNDPLQLLFNPPRVFPGADSSPDERAITYCSLYDNGFTNPDEVKRQSTSPPAPLAVIGGPCAVPTGCTAGRVGAACEGKGEVERNASCDSTAGAGDGFCDACPLRGGETTEDEMCILIGSYYVP